MSFFNKKEEVLEFQLTEHGKRLLENGVLKPAFYAFYDEDVLYDTTAAGFNEKQNDADRRIRFDTPSLKVQKSTLGVETRVQQFQANLDDLQETGPTPSGYLITENSVDFVKVFQDAPDYAQKFFLEADPLGTSDLKTNFAPAWHINLLENEISASEYYQVVAITGTLDNLDGVVRNIPQLDITVDYQTFYSNGSQLDMFTQEEVEKIVQLSEGNDAGVALYLQENSLLLDVQERNTDSLKENFDIEVFRNHPDGTLSKLGFIDASQELTTLGPDSVEYFINVSTDTEIPLDVLKRNNVDLRTVKGNVARTRLARDLYESENEEPC
jgi:hypothetical protein